MINETFRWIEQELKDKVDFVVWTGDSARHDNDEKIPRNAEQVVGLNEFMVHKMFEVFGKRKGDQGDEDPNHDFVIPVVPNLGNNDILPHNVMSKGPNAWTRTYARVWRQFIPEAQKHQFEQGGWFYVEVIPNKLAVFSLNSLYFFKNNAAVDGCASPREPGAQQLEWLRIQLQFMRERGVKAILTGHVPPVRQDAKTLWEESCWQKYALWQRQYRDVIVGSMYGHFNYDHFMLQDFEDLKKGTKRGRIPEYRTVDAEDDEIHAAVSADYFIQLRDQWSGLPEPPRSMGLLNQEEEDEELDSNDAMLLSPKSTKDKDINRNKRKDERKHYRKEMGGRYAERFAASFVSASVVPNFFPAIRVYEYNTTGLDQHRLGSDIVPAPAPFDALEYGDEERLDSSSKNKKKKRKKKHHKQKKYKFKVPDAPSKSAPPGPAYSPQSLSLLKYTQYYANLTQINNDFAASTTDEAQLDDELDALKWNEGKHKGKKPHERDHEPHPKKFKYQVHYDTQDDSVYQLKDLTVPSLVNLARRIGDFVPEDDDGPSQEADAPRHDKAPSHERKAKKHKKKHGKGKHGSTPREENEAWYTFIRRAFIETKSPDEIEEQFGY